MKEIGSLIAHAARVRRTVLQMCHKGRTSHIGSCLSVVDILTAIFASGGSRFAGPMTNPDRDTFVLSKGHAAAALYATIAESGLLANQELARFAQDDSALIGHANHEVPGVDVSTGSLGHGLAIATGIAMSRREAGGSGRAIVLLSDGECDEGSVWEAALLAGQLQLSGLIAVIDYNRLQGLGATEEIVGLEPFADKWRSFRWRVIECDGHSIEDLLKTLDTAMDGPLCIIARTVKGRGVSFMEGAVDWHYRSPNEDELAAALAEIAANLGSGVNSES